MILGLILEFDGKAGPGVRVVEAVRHDLATLEAVQESDQVRMPIEPETTRGPQSRPMNRPIHPGNAPQPSGIGNQRVQSPIRRHAESGFEARVTSLQPDQPPKGSLCKIAAGFIRVLRCPRVNVIYAETHRGGLAGREPVRRGRIRG